MHAANPGPDDGGGARTQRFGGGEPSLGDRFVGGHKQILGNRIAKGQYVRCKIRSRIEILDLSGNPYAAPVGPREARLTDTGTAIARGFPKGRCADSRSGNSAHTGDDNTPRARHSVFFFDDVGGDGVN